MRWLAVVVIAWGCTPKPSPTAQPDASVPIAAVSVSAPVDAAPAPIVGPFLPASSPPKKLDRATAKKVARSILKGADTVELVRIPWGTHDEPPPDPNGILGYAIESHHRAADPAGAGKMLDSFVGYTGDDSTKLPSCFEPHHALVVRAGEKRMEVAVCFDCARLELHVDGYDGSFEWSMANWENHEQITEFRRRFDALYDASEVPPAKDPRYHPNGPP